MSIFKMKPYYSEKIWGYEKWNLSTHRAGSSIIEESGQSLADYRKSQLPILIKIIKSEQSLSVQVHPGDEFARKYENDNGKTECWYILEADEDAKLVCGIKKGLNKEKLDKKDLETIIDCIYVYEDKIIIKLKSNIENMLDLGNQLGFSRKNITAIQKNKNHNDRKFFTQVKKGQNCSNVVNNGDPLETTLEQLRILTESLQILALQNI